MKKSTKCELAQSCGRGNTARARGERPLRVDDAPVEGDRALNIWGAFPSPAAEKLRAFWTIGKTSVACANGEVMRVVYPPVFAGRPT